MKITTKCLNLDVSTVVARREYTFTWIHASVPGNIPFLYQELSARMPTFRAVEQWSTSAIVWGPPSSSCEKDDILQVPLKYQQDELLI